MSENTIVKDLDRVRDDSPWKKIFLVVLAAGLGLTVGHIIGIVLVKLIYGGSLPVILRNLQYPFNQPAFKWPFMILQGAVSLSTFFLFPYFLAKRRYAFSLIQLFNTKNFDVRGIFLLVFITLLTMALSGSIGEWNKMISLPHWLDWMTSKDEILDRLTVYITTFDSKTYLLLSLVVIAIIPAVGEEFLFRGLLQPQFVKITGNQNTGILVTAFIFSAIHMQFYGLLPRMFIGVILGYVYVWKGSLVYPALIHLLNNGITIMLIYLHQIDVVQTDIEEYSIPFYITIIISAGLIASMIYYKRLSSQIS